MPDQSDNHIPDYITPLYTALMDRDFATARTLIDSGHSIDDEPADDGYTLLHHAAQKGDVEVVRFLLSSGCPRSLNRFDYVQHTPLMWAAEEGRLEIARMLIRAGADVDAYNEERIGNTAIREAAGAGDIRMVRLLLESGADPTIKGWMQMDALAEAKMMLSRDPTSKVRQQIVSMLEKAEEA